jgi:hypothetical protein
MFVFISDSDLYNFVRIYKLDTDCENRRKLQKRKADNSVVMYNIVSCQHEIPNPAWYFKYVKFYEQRLYSL